MDDSHYCPMPGSFPRVAPKGRIAIASVKIVYHTFLQLRLTVSRWSAGSALSQALYLYASATQSQLCPRFSCAFRSNGGIPGECPGE